MSKPSLRVHVIVHEDGRRTGRLLRVWDDPTGGPSPAAYGLTNDELFAELEAKLEGQLQSGTASLARYLWSDTFHTQKVRVDIHPLSSIKKRLVIGKKQIPLVLTYAYHPLEDGGYRVMLPRFGGWFIVEDLSLAAEVLRHAVSTLLLGENPRWVYDFRATSDEYVTDWSPELLTRAKAGPAPATTTDPHEELVRVADELVGRAARRKLAPTVGESTTFDAVRGLTVGPKPCSLLLVGPPGVGKSALVRRLAAHHLVVRKETGEARKIYSTSKDRIIAGMVYLGMWQERCIRLAKELAEDGDYLHVSALAGLVEPQPDGATIADFFEPAMADGEIFVIAECTSEELERVRRMRPSFVQRFRIVRIEPPTTAETISLALAYAKKRGGGQGASTRAALDLHPSAMKRLVRHLEALERGVAFPGKALRFLDWLALDLPSRESTRTLFPKDVSEAYARYSGVPISLLSDDIGASAEALGAMLKARVIGQDEACDACGRVLARFKANLVDPERPCGTLLFVGPTGVGKTELAKQLARTTFGGDDRMLRFDMSEYMRPGSVQRLTSARPGTMSLASRVREQPLSLVLFDEIEKAHSEVFDLLLGVLGEGRMTDDGGRFVDFRTTLIVMTSNLGVTDRLPVGFGAGEAERAPDFDRKVRAHFRPELYNRIDHVLSFRALSPADVERIVDLELDAVARRAGLVRRSLRLVATQRARQVLAERGYHPTRGARPLRRLVEELVMTPIAVRIAEDATLQNGTLAIFVDGDPEQVPGHVFSVRLSPAGRPS